jgi:3D (Asp-Asp-Asp) domain-containing protein
MTSPERTSARYGIAASSSRRRPQAGLDPSDSRPDARCDRTWRRPSRNHGSRATRRIAAWCPRLLALRAREPAILGPAVPWTVLGNAFFLVSLFGCTFSRPPPVAQPLRPRFRQMEVVATAYNSLPDQTDRNPTLSASGTALRPGLRVVAVSRDLLASGLGFGTRVRIEGLPGVWQVADCMAPRWRRRIDIYMGDSRTAAQRFGKRRLWIYWEPRDGSRSQGDRAPPE